MHTYLLMLIRGTLCDICLSCCHHLLKSHSRASNTIITDGMTPGLAYNDKLGTSKLKLRKNEQCVWEP